MVARQLEEVRARIARAATRAGRDPADVTLLAVSKGRDDDEVLAAYRAGQRDFGENRAAGLTERLRSDLPGDIRWHFVGTLQRRKVGIVAPVVVLLHSLDRLALARSWSTQEVASPVLLQVNVAREPQKHGFDPDELLDSVDRVSALGISVEGLMTIPPRPEQPEDSRGWFEMLAALGERLQERHPAAVQLSMGMTDDLEVAVEAGATIVRVGRAIFEPAPAGDTDRADVPR
ncbi:MAG: YggS family pyridoxal phosphate-dependent enzyme [Actinomycetota bacterium]|nr:YggS family pyridoxal phosphate-dependent enzyme [Actinomycetota bacterium]